MSFGASPILCSGEDGQTPYILASRNPWDTRRLTGPRGGNDDGGRIPPILGKVPDARDSHNYVSKPSG